MSRKLPLLLGGLLIPAVLFAGAQVDVSGIIGKSNQDNGLFNDHFGVQQVELAVSNEYADGIKTEAFATFYGDSTLQLNEANVIIANPFKTLLGVENKYLEDVTVKAGRQRLDFGIVNSRRAIQLQTVDRPLAILNTFGWNGAIADGGHFDVDFSLPTKWSLGVGAYNADTLANNLPGNSETVGDIVTLRATTAANFFGTDHQLGLSAFLNNSFDEDADSDAATILGADLTATRTIKGYDVMVQGEILKSTFHNSSNDTVTMLGAYGTIAAKVCDMCSLGFRMDVQDAAEGSADNASLNSSIQRYNFFMVRQASEHNRFKVQYVLEEEKEATVYAQFEFGLIAN